MLPMGLCLCTGALISGCEWLARRREESYDRYNRVEDYYRKKDDSCYDRYRDDFDRPPLSSEGQCPKEKHISQCDILMRRLPHLEVVGGCIQP